MKLMGSAMQKLGILAAAALTCACLVAGATAQEVATTGAVFISTNSAANNQVWQYTRATDGTLTLLGKFSTTGLGNSGVLGSQGEVILNSTNTYLFVVNAGSNDITSFSVKSTGLTVINKVASGGTKPVSLTIHGNLLYVLNASGTPNITAFKVGLTGALTQLANSTRLLSANTASPAQVGFNAAGTVLVVTEKKTNKIDTYTVARSGLATGPLVQNSVGAEPFGFAFDFRGRLIVSEGTNSTMSSYSVSSGGTLTVISASVPDFGGAACWVVNTNNPAFTSQYSYTSNTGSNSISGYQIGSDGSLALLSANTPTAKGPLDMALTPGSAYLYVVDGKTGEIEGYSVISDGSLSKVTTATGVPVGSVGMAAY